MAMGTEALFRLLARQIETLPAFPDGEALSEEKHRWLASTYALIGKVDSMSAIEFKVAQGGLGMIGGNSRSVQQLTSALHRALAKVELEAPAAVQGSFISVGHDFDAFAAVGKALSGARKDLLIVDPYLDATAVTDFLPLAPEGVPVRLLADEQGVKDSLAPAVRRWKTQHAERAELLDARIAPPRSLHDRVIVVDGDEAWILTQSLKDFAGRSPASVSRADPEVAKLKAEHYLGLWNSAVPVAS